MVKNMNTDDWWQDSEHQESYCGTHEIWWVMLLAYILKTEKISNKHPK